MKNARPEPMNAENKMLSSDHGAGQRSSTRSSGSGGPLASACSVFFRIHRKFEATTVMTTSSAQGAGCRCRSGGGWRRWISGWSSGD
jgi:hypothetical protein